MSAVPPCASDSRWRWTLPADDERSAADVEDGVKPGPRSDQLAELRELKRPNRLLEQENEVLRHARPSSRRQIQ
jgi:hypothetical protein